MINNCSVLAVVPARGGSKGVYKKNLRNLGGKPLIAWTIEESKKSRYIDRLILSSEDAEIIQVAKQYNCEVPFVRPLELARDDTPGIEPVLHSISVVSGYEYIVVLQPTSPFRQACDIDGCIENCIEKKANACVSIVEVSKNPYWMYSLDDHKKIVPLFPNHKVYLRRQDLPKIYALNGAVYFAKTDFLISKRTFLSDETIGYIMPPLRSVDIDTEMDLSFCSYLLSIRE